MADIRKPRVLHVIAAFDENEGQGRVMTTIAEHAHAEHHLVCGVLQRGGSQFVSVTQTGGSLTSFGRSDSHALAQAVAAVDPDVIHLHGGPQMSITLSGRWAADVPVLASIYLWSRLSRRILGARIGVHHLRDTPVLANRTVANTLMRPTLLTALLKRAGVKMILTQDTLVRDLAAPGAIPVVVATGVTPCPGSPAPTLRQPGRFVFAGRAELTRGPDVLAKAVEQARRRGADVSADFYLRSTRDADVVAAASRSPFCRVHVGDVDLAAEMASATAVVLPFRFDDTTLAPPLVATEALAGGTPVVGSDVHCVRGAVTDGVTGLLVPPGDVDALAGALVRLTSDADLAHRLGEAGATEMRRRWADSSIAETAGWAYGVLASQRAVEGPLDVLPSTHTVRG